MSLPTLDNEEGLGATPSPHGVDVRRDGLTVLGTLGTGGMSEVRLARQESMGRLIAVKGLLPKYRGARRGRRLLEEAWVTGHLEHPNVVPVHGVKADDDGSPLILLKRIEGRTWAEVIASPGLIRELGSAIDDPLVWHVSVLVAVCRAIEFAHSRGVVHRDIKPANVMVGRFGEVTVLDWGLAVCVSASVEGDNHLPRWSAVQGIVGTPAYMAPEMLRPHHPPDPMVDVYLLGSTLAHVLTGRAPHRGNTLKDVISAITGSQPPLAGPASLQALCRQAMAPEPDARPPSVSAFRQALERTLEDRSVDRLQQAAEHQLADLRDSLDEGPEVVVALVAACRFGFGEVLATRPAHTPARAGLDAALALAARHALAEQRPGLARAYLDEATDVPAELVDAVDSAMRAHADVVARAAAVIEAHDPVVGRRAVVLLAGALWVATSVVPALLIDFESADPVPLPMLAVTVCVGSLAAALVVARPQWVPNRVSRAFVALLALFPALHALTELGLRLQGVDYSVIVAMPIVVGLLVSLSGALHLDGRLGVAAAVYAGLWLAVSFGWVAGPPAVAMANLMLGLCCVWVFWSARR